MTFAYKIHSNITNNVIIWLHNSLRMQWTLSSMVVKSKVYVHLHRSCVRKKNYLNWFKQFVVDIMEIYSMQIKETRLASSSRQSWQVR